MVEARAEGAFNFFKPSHNPSDNPNSRNKHN